MPDGRHAGQHEHLVDVTGDMEFLADDLGAVERLMIHEHEVDALRVDGLGAVECGLHRPISVHARLDRCHRIQDRHVAAVMPLAQQVGEPLLGVHERLHVAPIRHAERVVRRSPFPPTAVGGVIHPMDPQQVETESVVAECGIHETRRTGAPAAAVEALQPDARALVERCDR